MLTPRLLWLVNFICVLKLSLTFIKFRVNYGSKEEENNSAEEIEKDKKTYEYHF